MAADSQPARQREPVGQRLKTLLIGTPLLLLGLMVFGAGIAWVVRSMKREAGVPRRAGARDGGAIIGRLRRGGTEPDWDTRGHVWLRSLPGLRNPRLRARLAARRISLGKTAMITAAVLMVVSLAFVG